MDFSIVSSMIVQKLFPTIVEQEVSSTVGDGCSLPLPREKTSKLPPPPPMLPPCRVCGEKASGFHYGANTCEACKGFFRRSLQRKDSYRCIGEGDCRIGQGKRNACAYCRYQKCLSVGMSKTAIKTGRYTHEKKTRDIREVKKLQRRHEQITSGRPITMDDMEDETETAVVEEDPAPETETDEDLEMIVKHITSVHLQQTPHTPEFFERLPSKEKDFLEQRAFQDQMFGPLKPIPKEEYMKIYQSTGIDIDGRREMIKHMIPCIEKAIKRFICFAKSLPGFKDLPINDQIALIKASKSDAWLVVTHRCFNTQYNLFTPLFTPTTSLEEMSKIHNVVYLEKLFTIARSIKAMELTQEETIVLASFIMLFPDRVELQSREKVEESQLLLLRALCYLFAKNNRHKCLIARCVAVTTEMRTLAYLRKREEEKFVMDWSDKVEFPQLMYEMWST